MNLKEMYARLKAIGLECENKTGDELTALLREAEEIKNKIDEARARQKLANIAKDIGDGDGGDDGNNGSGEAEARGEALKAKKAVRYSAMSMVRPNAETHTTKETVLRQHSASSIIDTFPQVSSVLDLVNFVPLIGGESFTQPFAKGYGEGDYTEEGAAYADTKTEFGKAVITKTKITAFEEESEEYIKLPAADYDGHVRRGVGVAVRKKLAREIMTGDGADGHLRGIFHNPVKEDEKVINPDTDIEAEAIDDTILDKLVYGYGGDEAVEDIGWLILNKKDLEALALLRGKDGRRLYDIVRRGNSGMIDGIPYVISSACKALSDPATRAGDYCMAYGYINTAYDLVAFSDMETKRDENYKFKEGIIGNRASAFMGGNVVMYNGIKRLKKAAGE